MERANVAIDGGRRFFEMAAALWERFELSVRGQGTPWKALATHRPDS
jgi:hypothetical protein